MLVNTLLTLTLAIASSAFVLPGLPGGGLQRIIKRADVTITSDVNISGPSISLPVSLTSSTDGLSTDYASPSATTVMSGAGPEPSSIPSNGTGEQLSQAADLLAQYLDQSVAAGSENSTAYALVEVAKHALDLISDHGVATPYPAVPLPSATATSTVLSIFNGISSILASGTSLIDPPISGEMATATGPAGVGPSHGIESAHDATATIIATNGV